MIVFKKITSWIAVILALHSVEVYAQQPNFSMYHYTPFFTNPGQIGVEEDVRLMLNYRNQAIEVGNNFTSSTLSGYYPIYLGNHRLVVAGNFLHDRVPGFVSTNGGLLGVAYSIRTTANSELSLGLQGGYFHKETGGDFTTDDQFIDGVFDPNVVPGDAVLNRSVGYPTLSLGLFYRVKDAQGREKAFAGGSIFNANEPSISLVDNQPDNLPLSWKGTAGYRVYQGLEFSVLPTLRWVGQAGNSFLNLGTRFSYDLENTANNTKRLELGLWYNTNDLGVLSMAYEQSNLIISASYDLPLSNRLSTGQNGIFELAVSFRLKKKSKPYVPKETKLGTSIKTVPLLKDQKTKKNSVDEREEEIVMVPGKEKQVEGGAWKTHA